MTKNLILGETLRKKDVLINTKDTLEIVHYPIESIIK